MNYTKGNWYAKENGGKGKLVGVASTLSDWFIAEEVLKSNADLISAAPDMYEAIKEYIGLVCSESASESLEDLTETFANLERVQSNMKCALKKAEGKL